MTMQVSTLRPGLLVSLKTSVRGNVKYSRRDIEKDHRTEDGGKLAKWETERHITDPAEHDAAQETRSKAGHVIRRVCSMSAFGLLCPEDKADVLEAGIAEARKICDEFNAKAALTQVSVYVMTGRVAADDVEAVKAINSEIRDLMSEMEEGLANLDVKSVRAAAAKARQIGQMMSPDAASRIQRAIDLARESARRMVKAGEEAAVEVDRATIKRIAEQRTAFLDIDEVQEVRRPSAEGRSVDFAPLS